MEMKACSCGSHPDEFTDDQWRRVDEVIAHHRGRPGALIPVLEEVQGITGYLPESVQRRVSSGLDIPLAQIYGVVTFYSFFTMSPRGKHQIRLCLGTACHVRGGQAVLESIEDKLHIEAGGITEDRQFSLELVRCLGACGLAPVMTIGEDIHRQVKAAKVDQALAKYRDRSAE